MEQLDLVTIRKQPLQPEPEVPSRTIRAYVRENLRGFVRRQRERERVRKLFREKYAEHRSHKIKTSNMRNIKVTFRAVFHQPVGILNPMGLQIPGNFLIELFQKGSKWKVREITARRQVYEKLGRLASLEHAKTEMAFVFQQQLTPWQIWGIPPQETMERQLSPDDVCDLGHDQFGWYQAEDRTHIIHAPTIPPGARIPPAACGAKVNAKCFISTKANVEPTCKSCAEIWRQHYKGKS